MGSLYEYCFNYNTFIEINKSIIFKKKTQLDHNLIEIIIA